MRTLHEVFEFIRGWEYSVSFILMAIFAVVCIVALLVAIVKMISGALDPGKELSDKWWGR